MWIIEFFDNKEAILLIDKLTAGRDPSCNITFNDKKVSRKHLTLQIENGTCTLTDTSSHGTFANNRKLEKKTPFKIEPNTTIYLGGPAVNMKFHVKYSKSRFVFSGVKTSEKQKFVGFVQKCGSEAVDLVSKEVDYLVTSEPAKISLKLLYALIFNLKIVKNSFVEELMKSNGKQMIKASDYEPEYAQEVVANKFRNTMFEGRTLFFNKSDYHRCKDVVQACHGKAVLLDPGKSLKDTLEPIQNFAVFTLKSPTHINEANSKNLETSHLRKIYEMIVKASTDASGVKWYDRFPGAEIEPISPPKKAKPDREKPKPVSFVKKKEALPHKTKSCVTKKKKPIFRKRKRNTQDDENEENVDARPALKKAKRPSVISIGKLPESQGSALGSFSEDLLSMVNTQPSEIVEESPEIKLKEESEPPENSHSEDSERQPIQKPRKRLPSGKFIRLREGHCTELGDNQIEMEIVIHRPRRIIDQDDEKQAEDENNDGLPNFKKFKRKGPNYRLPQTEFDFDFVNYVEEPCDKWVKEYQKEKENEEQMDRLFNSNKKPKKSPPKKKAASAKKKRPFFSQRKKPRSAKRKFDWG